jgi:predicted RNA binding protein YcfA (HicA-like mRNA interferase family)
MGSKLKTLSGVEVVKILEAFGFGVHSQKGSHIKLHRRTIGTIETLIIPGHDPISKGTLQKIFKQASRYISQEDLRGYFYTQ